MCPDPGRAPTDVVDLFSGGGGMSCGFARTPGFRLVGAVDLERGKPSAGATGCNGTYKANIGIDPHRADLATLTPDDLREAVLRTAGVDLAPGRLGVLAACPPCTDFSRAKPSNHLVDGGRNDLVGRAAGRLTAIMRATGIPAAGAALHAFAGSRETAAELQGLGLHLSFEAVRPVLQAVAADRLLLESDAPSGEREPAQVPALAQAAAQALGRPELAAQARDNAARLFRRLIP